jgi:hypothetical protein
VGEKREASGQHDSFSSVNRDRYVCEFQLSVGRDCQLLADAPRYG